MATDRIYHNGTQDFQLNELRNWKTHIYATIAQMNADLSSSVARIVYVVEDGRFYFGKSGAWVGLGAASSFETAVDTPGDLPTVPTPPTGQVRVVKDDPDNNNLPAIWIFDGTDWQPAAEEDLRIVIIDGTHAFTGIPKVTDPNTVAPTSDEHLVTKKYADDADTAAIAAHVAALDPHPQYTTDAEATTIADTEAAAAITAHEAALDPHPQYTTDAEAATIADTQAAAAIAIHDAEPTPHAAADFQTSAQVGAAIAGHDADPDAHGGVIQQLKDMLEGVQEEAGQLSDDLVFVPSGLAYGTPVTKNGVSGLYELPTSPEQVVGLAVAASTITAVDTAVPNIDFDNATSSIDISGYGMTGFLAGHVYNFPGAALNGSTNFVVRRVEGTVLYVDPPPQTEAGQTSNIDRGEHDGTVVFGGRIPIPEERLKLDSIPADEIVVDIGAGEASITVPAGTNLSSVMPGDLATLVGTTDNDGSGYIIARIDGLEIILAGTETDYNENEPITNADAGTKTFTLGGAPDLSAAEADLALDKVVKFRVSGSTSGSNDKVFSVTAIDNTLKTVTVTETVVDDVTGSGTLYNDEDTQLPGTDDTANGAITIVSYSEAHDFKDATYFDSNADRDPVDFFFDIGATNLYSESRLSGLKLGRQIDRYTFIVDLQKISSKTQFYDDTDAGDTIEQSERTIVFYDDAGGACALNMPPGRDGDEIIVKNYNGGTNGITLTRDGADVFEGGGNTNILNTAYAKRTYKFYDGIWFFSA